MKKRKAREDFVFAGFLVLLTPFLWTINILRPDNQT